MRSITRKNTPGIHGISLLIAVSVLILLLIAQPASINSAEDTQKKPLSPEQTLNRYRLSSPLLSPDGSCVAFVLSDPVKGTSSKSNIYIYKIKDKALIHFTNSTKSDRHPRWGQRWHEWVRGADYRSPCRWFPAPRSHQHRQRDG